MIGDEDAPHKEKTSDSPSLEEGGGGGGDNRHAMDIDPVAEKKLVRKLDQHIVPVVMLLYLLSFLDRFVPPI